MEEPEKKTSAAKKAYPLPRIDEMIGHAGKAKWFSKLDLHSGFHHISILQEHVEQTAFKTKYGAYQFKVMPFGLCKNPLPPHQVILAVPEVQLQRSAAAGSTGLDLDAIRHGYTPFSWGTALLTPGDKGAHVGNPVLG